MTTPTDDAPDNPAGVDEIASPDTAPKVRRFAPRRSRSTAPAATAVEGTAPKPAAASRNVAPTPAADRDASPARAAAGHAERTVGTATVQPQTADAAPRAANTGTKDAVAMPQALDTTDGGATPAALDGGAALGLSADLADSPDPAVGTLNATAPIDAPPQAPARPSRRARNRRSPRLVAATDAADEPTSTASGQTGDDLVAATVSQDPAIAAPGSAADPASLDLAADATPAKPKRIRSRSRSRVKDVVPAPAAPIVAPPTPPAPRRSHHRRAQGATPVAAELPSPVASETPPATETMAPVKPARPRRNRSRRPAAASTPLEPDALSMLGTVPAAALAALEASPIATPVEDADALQLPGQPEEMDLTGIAAPALDAAGVLASGQSADEVPPPAAPALNAFGTDTVAVGTMGSLSPPAISSEALGTGTVALSTSQTALPTTPAPDRAGAGRDGLFSAAEAALAADRYEAAARRGQVGGGSGDAILAQALRELFPLLPDLSDDTPAIEEVPEAGQIEDDQQDADQAELEADADDDSGIEDDEQGELQDSEANRRRGRRGRRGGRGRRRNGAAAQPLDADGRDAQDDEDEGPVVDAPGIAASSLPATSFAVPSPVAPPSDSSDAFTLQTPPVPERSWREGGPRRPWGRTYRDSASAGMPAPKPANGIRPGPIPQAAPPEAAIVVQPEVATPNVPAFAMPNLRLNEPLNPGETRTERLLEAQTILLRTMLQQQARQIDVLTAAVDGLRQSVQGLAGGGARGYMPRTAIFVDAPNVVYAADNARVQLDYGRMLKYFSKDRHLVHALSYSPIIDDVREGIRYETQRFVAPFLRTGWKLITKPLKRFSDGSAKGNFDIELAVDIVTMSERLDIVVLVSGDSDFERLIQLIQSRGVRVEVVAFASNVSTELVNIADVFIDIGQHLEHLKAL